MKSISDKVRTAYEKNGVQSAIKEAEKYPSVTYKYCQPCDAEMPTKKNECLVCGSTIQNADLFRDINNGTKKSFEYSGELFLVTRNFTGWTVTHHPQGNCCLCLAYVGCMTDLQGIAASLLKYKCHFVIGKDDAIKLCFTRLEQIQYFPSFGLKK